MKSVLSKALSWLLILFPYLFFVFCIVALLSGIFVGVRELGLFKGLWYFVKYYLCVFGFFFLVFVLASDFSRYGSVIKLLQRIARRVSCYAIVGFAIYSVVNLDELYYDKLEQVRVLMAAVLFLVILLPVALYCVLADFALYEKVIKYRKDNKCSFWSAMSIVIGELD